MKEIKAIAKALSVGDVKKAHEVKMSIGALSRENKFEIDEIVRQAIISFLKKGDIDNAKKIENLFKVSKESLDDTVKQAVLSSFRDGDLKTISGLRDGLPIPSYLAEELISYCSSWGKADYADCMKAVFA